LTPWDPYTHAWKKNPLRPITNQSNVKGPKKKKMKFKDQSVKRLRDQKKKSMFEWTLDLLIGYIVSLMPNSFVYNIVNGKNYT
jgi:hypothetical protein